MKKRLLLFLILLCLSIFCFSNTIYVDSTAVGNNDGSSWAHAYSDLQNALENAAPGDSILVAKGTYKPAGSGGDVAANFLINIDITLLGGYPNGGGDRNPELYETILSGDLNGDDVEGNFFTKRDDNAMTVVNIRRDVTNETVIDGFTISHGHADGPNNNLENRGAGLFSQGSPIISNCLFAQNYAGAFGAGAYLVAGVMTNGVSVEVHNCRFEKNRSNFQGAGLMMEADGQDASFTVTGCEFSENIAVQNGGGVMILRRETASGASVFSVNGCIFKNNHAVEGGAIKSYILATLPVNASINIENSLIAEHSNTSAAISAEYFPKMHILNCTIADNQSSGIELANQSYLTLQNTILANPGFAEYIASTNDATVESLGGNLVLDNSLDAQLDSSSDQSGVAPDFDTDYFPIDGGNLINEGINDGVTAIFDLAGNDRIQFNTVDIGAYESPYPTSAREVIVGEISLSPNPAFDLVNIELPESLTKPTEISLFDAQGRMIWQQFVTDGERMQVSHLPNGFYSLKLMDGERVYVGKFIKH